LARRLSQDEKKEITQCFSNGISINKLSERFNCTELTISRNLKKILGNEEYKQILKRLSQKKNDKVKLKNAKPSKRVNISNEPFFVEIAPLNTNFYNEKQKDISSIPLASVIFPKTVYMVVDRKIELEIKFLRDFPEWQFLPEAELERKAIEIFADLKNAKISCNKDQKVIKVPNTNVFEIVAPILIARGISRMIKEDKLIAI
tara:strand:+ start:519 stop:1127 length:609 start_codon:yes stop_codon:yes gene_type:complete